MPDIQEPLTDFHGNEARFFFFLKKKRSKMANSSCGISKMTFVPYWNIHNLKNNPSPRGDCFGADCCVHQKWKKKKIIGQIEKQVEVIKAYYHTEDEIIYQEFCIFKMKSSLLFDEREIQNIIKDSNAQIVTVNKEFFVIEKSGIKEEIELLYRELSVFGIMQYSRSGRIAVTKEEMQISKMLEIFNH